MVKFNLGWFLELFLWWFLKAFSIRWVFCTNASGQLLAWALSVLKVCSSTLVYWYKIHSFNCQSLKLSCTLTALTLFSSRWTLPLLCARLLIQTTISFCPVSVCHVLVSLLTEAVMIIFSLDWMWNIPGSTLGASGIGIELSSNIKETALDCRVQQICIGTS